MNGENEQSRRGRRIRIAPDIAYQRLGMVNFMFVGGAAGDRGWVLIDAAIPGMSRGAPSIRQATA